jgi:hypothetical protein
MSGVWNTKVSVRIDEQCPMRFRVHNKDVVEFWGDGDRNEFDVSFEVEALRRFLELGTRAVADADALRAQNGRNQSEQPDGAGVS